MKSHDLDIQWRPGRIPIFIVVKKRRGTAWQARAPSREPLAGLRPPTSFLRPELRSRCWHQALSHLLILRSTLGLDCDVMTQTSWGSLNSELLALVFQQLSHLLCRAGPLPVQQAVASAGAAAPNRHWRLAAQHEVLLACEAGCAGLYVCRPKGPCEHYKL